MSTRRSLLVAALCLMGLLTACSGSEPGEGGPDGGTEPTEDGGGDGGTGDGGVQNDGGVTPPVDGGVPALVFVSRRVMPEGSIYWDVPKAMPGVGAHSRVRPSVPGRLLVREPDGRMRVLIDGEQSSPQTMNLVDVNGPSVSYDGMTIVFAGLPAGNYNTSPARSIGAWRLYAINADGTNLKQVTRSDQSLDYGRFGGAADGLQGYDDYDPAFLPDGRIVFSSTRYPAYGQYSGVRASNLYVVNLDGTRMHRITAERNGADRALVDPVTGKIVYARWWRNHRFPTNDMSTVTRSGGGFDQKDGLTTNRNNPVGGPDMFRNGWQAATLNPDGTGLEMWNGRFRLEEKNHVYGGAFSPEGVFFANFFPMYNMTEASGFGGIRRYERGAHPYKAIIGVADFTLDYVSAADPVSYGIFKGTYAAEPEVLLDGRLVVSLASDVQQDYGLYVVGEDGQRPRLLYDLLGTAEVRARVLAPRPKPPVLPDLFRDNPGAPSASLLPPTEDGPFDVDGTFVFRALNVYANAPVDSDIVSAPAVGSAATIRFFIDHQRTSPGSFPHLDWPILLGEKAIAPDGFAEDPAAPANVSLFEQLRGPASQGYRVPLTGGPNPDGAGHVAGMNFGPPGAVVRCMGCHAGHTMIPVPASDEEAKWTNLAPGATVTVSSTQDPTFNTGVIDRRVMKGEIWRYWRTPGDQHANQWVQLTFPVPVTVRKVRLYNPRSGGEANVTVQVGAATVKLYSDAAATQQVSSGTADSLSVSGTDVSFPDVKALVVRVELSQVTGTFYGARVASLGEIEVIARGEAP
ncbi:TolB family protein [Hyalangium sp.]|uniref:TolB family protein n=1 Tax=Hyalangium sp. TaxID=2028555 RepID=UPI002D6E403D|nr:hypothetical protein [Hyalangium sp.]HYH99160.1 hypothetical protein [Hyalangium sp.]